MSVMALTLVWFTWTQAPNSLTHRLGRNEFRIWYEPFPMIPGRTVTEYRLPERLERAGYRRVHHRPKQPGTFFWGNQSFWWWTTPTNVDPGTLLGVTLDSQGLILGPVEGFGQESPQSPLSLPAELMSESLQHARAPRLTLPLESYPTWLWQALLAAEDSRFFEHAGVDGKAIARSLLRNVQSGKIVMGGSTLTQQLIKNRDLSSERTLRRKANEAWRALKLESEYEKKDILEAYMNHVYLGHLNGLGIYGFATAARVYFRKAAQALTLAESATLAAMVQGPNRLQPHDDVAAVQQRRNWVLSRMTELGMIGPKEEKRAKAHKVVASIQLPKSTFEGKFLKLLQDDLFKEKERHFEHGRGAEVFATLDPLVQECARQTVQECLATHRSRCPNLVVALISLDLQGGGILAYVDGSAQKGGTFFDHVRSAERPMGSTIKPLVALLGFERRKGTLFPGILIQDTPLSVALPGQSAWDPRNTDGRFHGTVSLREAMVHSYNIPFVRLGQHLGWQEVYAFLRDWGLNLPAAPTPATVLGAIEVTPIALAEAYVPLFRAGKSLKTRTYSLALDQDGDVLDKRSSRTRRSCRASSAYLVFDMLRDVVQSGTGKRARLSHADVAGKTGTSSDNRDGWFVGAAGSILTVVWLGTDQPESLPFPASEEATQVWSAMMRQAIPMRPPLSRKRPPGVLECRIDPKTGLRGLPLQPGLKQELYRRGGAPRRDLPWRNELPALID
jgi:penicillin-binding protein 1B